MAASLFTPFSKNNVPNLKLTPTSNSTHGSVNSRSGNRSPHKPHNMKRDSLQSDISLSLKRVVGCSTAAFSSHAGLRSFAYTAGAAAIVVTLDEDFKVSQRFYRARPNVPTKSLSNQYPLSATPSNEPSSKSRIAQSLRESGFGISPVPTPLGSPFGMDESPGSKTWSARERVKAATSVSFSPDGKWLAIGESGYNPRILIFSTNKDASCDYPVAAMAEHTFGVRKVAFSPCSRYLASIGTINDGFVYIWSLQNGKNMTVRLHSSNKCTSVVKDIAWMGRSLITVGIRHVKIWRTEDEVRPHSPGPKVLHGRNAILGDLADVTMTCVVGLSDDKAILCSDKGDICLLDDTGQRLTRVANAEFGINCMSVDEKKEFAWVGGRSGNIRALVLSELLTPSTPPISPTSSRSSSPMIPEGGKPANVMAMSTMHNHIFTLDANRSIKVISMTTTNGVPTPTSVVSEFPAHRDSVMGVRLLPKQSKIQGSFFTWSTGGLVLFWDIDGKSTGEFQVDLEQPPDAEHDPNELKVVRIANNGEFIVSGDKYGVLRVFDGESRKPLYCVKAHATEILDAQIYQDDNLCLLATCGRDRIVQVFARQKGNWDIAQTLDDHTATVSKVLFMDNGKRLLSCSIDRTVVVRQLISQFKDDEYIAYAALRKYCMKASPVHMTPLSDASNYLMVSTMDRQIHKFDLNSGKSVNSFRAADDSGDAVVMDALTLARDSGRIGRRLIVGVSTTDKSIRLYDLDGNLMEKEWGHTEGVTDIALLETDEGDDLLISTGTDGTIMVWGFSHQKAVPEPVQAEQNTGDLTATRTPLRRVLSKASLAARSPDLRPESSISNDKDSDKEKDVSKERTPQATPQNLGSSPPRTVRRKTSHMSIKRTSMHSQGTPTPTPSSNSDKLQMNFGNLGPDYARDGGRRSTRDRSPSPPDGAPKTSSRRPSTENRIDLASTPTNSSAMRTRGKSAAPDQSGLTPLADNLARSLRSFRKKLEGAGRDAVRPDTLRDLEREISLTRKVLIGRERERDSKNREESMEKLLDVYSEKLLSMLSDRLDDRLSIGNVSMREDTSSRGGASESESEKCVCSTPKPAQKTTETTGED